MNDGLINIDFNTEQKSDVRKKEVVYNLRQSVAFSVGLSFS